MRLAMERRAGRRAIGLGIIAMAAVVLAWFASVALIRHGVRPLLHIADDRAAHYVANVVTLAGVAAWIGLLVVTGVVLSILLGWHAF